MKSLGSKLKQLRKDMGLRQSDVVGDHLSRTMLSKIENDTAKPSLDTIEYLANKFNRPVSYFLDDESYNYSYIKGASEQLFHELSLLFRRERYELIAAPKILERIGKFSNNDIYKGRLLYLYVHSAYNMSDYANNIDKITLAINILKEFDDYYYLSRSYFVLALHYSKNECLEKSLQEGLKANDLLEISYVDDIVLRIKLLYLIGRTNYLLSDFRQSETYLNELLELSYRSHVHIATGSTYLILGIIYNKSCDFIKAREIALDAEKYFLFQKDKVNLSLTYANLANFNLELNNLEESNHYLIKYKNSYPECHDKHTLNFTQMTNLRLAARLGDFLTVSECLSSVDLTKFDYYHSRIVADLQPFVDSLGSKSDIEKIADLVTNKTAVLDVKHLSHYYGILSTLYSKTGDYENAFKYLKLSQESNQE